MKITAKKGFEIEIEVSGFANEPKLAVSFAAMGKSAKNADAKIIRNGKIAEGIFLTQLNGYIECPVLEIEKAISELPQKVKTFIPLEKENDGIQYIEWVRNDGMEIGQIMKSFLKQNYDSPVSVEEATAKYESVRVVKPATAKVEGIIDDNIAEGIEPLNGIEV